MDSNTKPAIENYLSKVIQRLQGQNFKIAQNITYKKQTFNYAAKRTRFEVEKFGFVKTVFLFSRFSSLDTGLLREFSAQSFQYAKKGPHLPRGVIYLRSILFPSCHC